MKNYKIMDGNEACITASYLFSEVCGIYPITPSSPMATLADKWASTGKTNILGGKVNVVEMQSEGGASALVHGSLQAGSLTSTFTASQGLLLMIPSMYKIAGELLPAVFHVAARSLSTHALSIFGDHQDIYATRMTGFAMLSSISVQDAYYLAIVSHLSAIKGSVPFLHFFDGFRTSHELNKINILNEETIKDLIDYDKINEFRNRAINLGKNITRGTSQTEDVYFQNTEARNLNYMELPDIVNDYMEKLNNIAGTSYAPFVYHGNKNAKNIIIAMGSVNDTIKEVVEDLNNKGEEVGVITVHLYRPFSVKYLKKVLPKSVEKIAVLDRTKEAGSNGEPLYLDVVNALKGENIEIVGGRYGLSSKDTTPAQIKAVFDNLNRYKVINNFTIGITDDVTNLSLMIPNYNIEKKWKEIKIYGFGSDGMVSASKNIMKVIGQKDGNFVQGYFEYDSKKSNGVTISHLRISDAPINAPYYLTSPSLVVVSKDSYLTKYNLLENIKQNGIFLLNSNKTDEELNEYMPNDIKEQILDKKLRVFITNADELANKYNLNGKINNIISIYVLKMLGCTSEDIEKFKDQIKSVYKDKGEEVVNNNISALEESTSVLRELDVNNLTITKEQEEKVTTLTDYMLKRRGNLLKVSDFLTHKDGTFEGGTSKSEKRKVMQLVPKWNKENCIECNECALVCPHAVIRPFSMTKEELNKVGLSDEKVLASFGEDDKYFYISVSESNCTGCGLCIDTCPGKAGKKALSFGNYSDEEDKLCDELTETVENKTIFKKETIKGLGFVKPVFEFNGACAGCGETPYIRILTELYKDEIVIANATGCSSIYGASLPCTPYSIPWISSLFEDNAEFGLGLHTSYKNIRENLKNTMYKIKDEVKPEIKDIYKEFIDNFNDSEKTIKIKKKLLEKETNEEIKSLIDYIPARKIWIIGGDGWAYDIGYGGLDHVLWSGEDVKILVLDTEVYSNTGGQKSKSTKTSAVAEFAAKGKTTTKKDLFKVAMGIPNVYVASICLGSNKMQAIKAFKEAHEHNGPAIIIAYSPCIEHGIKGGMKNALEEEKFLVDSGYNILMRYNGNKLIIDSKEPDFSLYEEVFKRELRYRNLKELNSEEYMKLYEQNIDDAKNRYQYYKNIEMSQEKDSDN